MTENERELDASARNGYYFRESDDGEGKARMWVEVRCADPGVAFRGEWPGPEGPEEILAIAREKAIASGFPVQVEIQGHGVWSIEPTGKVHPGRLFRPEKLPGAKGKKVKR